MIGYASSRGYGGSPSGYGLWWLISPKYEQQGVFDALVPDILQPKKEKTIKQKGMARYNDLNADGIPDDQQPELSGGTGPRQLTATVTGVRPFPGRLPHVGVGTTPPGPADVGTAGDALAWPPFGAQPVDVYVGPIPTQQQATAYVAEEEEGGGIGLGTIAGVGVGLVVLLGGGYWLFGGGRRRRR